MPALLPPTSAAISALAAPTPPIPLPNSTTPASPLPLPTAPPIPSTTLFLILLTLSLLPASLPSTHAPYFPLARTPTTRHLRTSPLFAALDLLYHLLTLPLHLYRTRSLRGALRALHTQRLHTPPETLLPARSTDGHPPARTPLDRLRWLLPLPAALSLWVLSRHATPRPIALAAAAWTLCWGVNAALLLAARTGPDPKPAASEPPTPPPRWLRVSFYVLGTAAFAAPHLWVLSWPAWSMLITPDEDTYIMRFGAEGVLQGLFVWGRVLDWGLGGGWRPWVVPVPVVLAGVPGVAAEVLERLAEGRRGVRSAVWALRALQMGMQSFVVLLVPFMIVIWVYVIVVMALFCFFGFVPPLLYAGLLVLVPGGVLYGPWWGERAGERWPQHLGWRKDRPAEKWDWWFLAAFDEKVFVGQQLMWAAVLCWGVYGGEEARAVWRACFSWIVTV